MNNNVETTGGMDGEIVLYQPDESISIEVRLEQETVWLTQAQMVELFKSTKQNISLHINNIYKEGELTRTSTVKDYLTVQTEGRRTVKRTLIYYNLDVIISVGYRVKSQVGTRFRQWANAVIKQHLLNGYTINRHLVALQQQVDSRFEALEQKVDEQQQQVEFLVDMHRQPEDRLFPTGCVFDAWEYVAGLVREAKNRIAFDEVIKQHKIISEYIKSPCYLEIGNSADAKNATTVSDGKCASAKGLWWRA